MTSAGQTLTSLGALSCSYVAGVRAHRIGFRPAPWEWTPCPRPDRYEVPRPLPREVIKLGVMLAVKTLQDQS